MSSLFVIYDLTHGPIYFHLGSNVIIDGAYIWNNVVIEDNCEVYRSIVADNVHIMAGVKVEMGCIVSYGVRHANDLFFSLNPLL